MFKRNWYLFTPLVLVAVPGLLVFYYISKFGYTPVEAWQSVKYFVQSNTRYAVGFTEVKFDRIRQGMDGEQVFKLVGVPSERHDNDTEWVYSLAQGSTPYYHERLVLFAPDKQGVLRVKETVKRFHDNENEK